MDLYFCANSRSTSWILGQQTAMNSESFSYQYYPISFQNYKIMVDLGKYKQKSQPKILFWANQLKMCYCKAF